MEKEHLTQRITPQHIATWLSCPRDCVSIAETAEFHVLAGASLLETEARRLLVLDRIRKDVIDYLKHLANSITLPGSWSAEQGRALANALAGSFEMIGSERSFCYPRDKCTDAMARSLEEAVKRLNPYYVKDCFRRKGEYDPKISCWVGRDLGDDGSVQIEGHPGA